MALRDTLKTVLAAELSSEVNQTRPATGFTYGIKQVRGGYLVSVTLKYHDTVRFTWTSPLQTADMTSDDIVNELKEGTVYEIKRRRATR